MKPYDADTIKISVDNMVTAVSGTKIWHWIGLFGLLYLSASLSCRGIESEVFDQSVDEYSFGKLARQIKNEKPLFVGIYSDSFLKHRVFKLVKNIKELIPEIEVVVGGPAYFEYAYLHENGVDIE